jgi:hypothetical protein
MSNQEQMSMRRRLDLLPTLWGEREGFLSAAGCFSRGMKIADLTKWGRHEPDYYGARQAAASGSDSSRTIGRSSGLIPAPTHIGRGHKFRGARILCRAPLGVFRARRALAP